jgi:hypothetical protein
MHAVLVLLLPPFLLLFFKIVLFLRMICAYCVVEASLANH